MILTLIIASVAAHLCGFTFIQVFNLSYDGLLRIEFWTQLKDLLGKMRRSIVDVEPDTRSTEMSHSYVDDYWCNVCNGATAHIVHDNGHERDSSSDYRRCTTCGSVWYGGDTDTH